MAGMSPLTYIVKAGAANLGELAQLKRTDPESSDVLRRWAVEEMTVLGIEVQESAPSKPTA